MPISAFPSIHQSYQTNPLIICAQSTLAVERYGLLWPNSFGVMHFIVNTLQVELIAFCDIFNGTGIGVEAPLQPSKFLVDLCNCNTLFADPLSLIH